MDTKKDTENSLAKPRLRKTCHRNHDDTDITRDDLSHFATFLDAYYKKHGCTLESRLRLLGYTPNEYRKLQKEKSILKNQISTKPPELNLGLRLQDRPFKQKIEDHYTPVTCPLSMKNNMNLSLKVTLNNINSIWK